jgi:hypothetical protein
MRFVKAPIGLSLINPIGLNKHQNSQLFKHNFGNPRGNPERLLKSKASDGSESLNMTKSRLAGEECMSISRMDYDA